MKFIFLKHIQVLSLPIGIEICRVGFLKGIELILAPLYEFRFWLLLVSFFFLFLKNLFNGDIFMDQLRFLRTQLSVSNDVIPLLEI